VPAVTIALRRRVQQRRAREPLVRGGQARHEGRRRRDPPQREVTDGGQPEVGRRDHRIDQAATDHGDPGGEEAGDPRQHREGDG
jgi:hypothetical protein